MTSIQLRELIEGAIDDLVGAVAKLHSARLKLDKFGPPYMGRSCSQFIRLIEDLLNEVKARQLQ